MLNKSCHSPIYTHLKFLDPDMNYSGPEYCDSAVHVYSMVYCGCQIKCMRLNCIQDHAKDGLRNTKFNSLPFLVT
jgi:hypothetical protein